MTNVIAEIGINFGGNIDVAKDLILKASRAGCWGVKFQFRNIENFYFVDNEIGDAIVRSEIKKNNLTFNQISILHKYTNSLGLEFGMSFFRKEDLDFYLSHISDPDFYKVPSAECMNADLVDALLDLNKKVLISTGGHRIEEVINQYSDNKYKHIIILHCIANYPADLGIQNLSKIKKIAETHQSGYSSHDVDYEVCIAAIAMGANWIERHLTINKDGTGLDDSSSSTEEEIKVICKFAKLAEEIVGVPDSPPNQGEILNMQNLGTGLYLKRNIEAGRILSLDDCVIASPRKGLSVGEFEKSFKGKKTTRDLYAGSPITEMSFTVPIKALSCEELAKAKQKRITIPVRIHDLEIMRRNIGTGSYEFHLSYEEVLSDDIERIKDICNAEENYSIHLPDYIPGNRIFDPLSIDGETNQLSRKVLQRTERLANKLEQFTGSKVPIVGSFSQRNTMQHEEFFERLVSEVIISSKQLIYPQWLPVNAWYFGGTVKLDVFNNEKYIEMIEKHNIKICLDLCHVVLSANSHGANYTDWIERLMPYSGHLHVADAIGEDGEGLPLGTGLPLDYNNILENKDMKVIEVWQGHFDEGYKFKQAVKYLLNKEK
jgi:sialic acid synthase SpsE/sugar phosphate isomerase/epimerase